MAPSDLGKADTESLLFGSCMVINWGTEGQKFAIEPGKVCASVVSSFLSYLRRSVLLQNGSLGVV
jgi:hypothetical protein